MKLNKEQIKAIENLKDDAFGVYWDYINEHLEQVVELPFPDVESVKQDMVNDEFKGLCYEILEIN